MRRDTEVKSLLIHNASLTLCRLNRDRNRILRGRVNKKLKKKKKKKQPNLFLGAIKLFFFDVIAL